MRVLRYLCKIAFKSQKNMARKEIYIEEKNKHELELIVAEANGKSVQTFLADLFLAWRELIHFHREVPYISIQQDVEMKDLQKVTYIHDEYSAYTLRIMAVKNKTSLTNYMRSIVNWLCEEHRANGRVWIDDTPVKALPIRTRK